MKIKSGKELTQLEIIKRLNLMGVKYDSTINGKNYYINLYDKQVISPSKQEKIKKELEKDKIYLEYLTNNLRKTRQNSIEYPAAKKKIITNIENKKYFFNDFNIALCNGTLLCYNTFSFINNNKKIIKKNLDIPVNCLKKYAKDFLNHDICNLFKTVLRYLDKIGFDVYNYLYIIIFICVVIILIFFSIKSKKQKSFQKRRNNSVFI